MKNIQAKYRPSFTLEELELLVSTLETQTQIPAILLYRKLEFYTLKIKRDLALPAYNINKKVNSQESEMDSKLCFELYSSASTKINLDNEQIEKAIIYKANLGETLSPEETKIINEYFMRSL